MEHHAPALLPWVWTTRAATGCAETPKDADGSMPGNGSSAAGSEAPAPEERIEVGSIAQHVASGKVLSGSRVCRGQ